MAFSNLLSTNAFLVAYALSEQAGSVASPAPVKLSALRQLKGVSDMPAAVLHITLQELEGQRMLDITRTEGKEGLDGVATVRATRALTEYVDGFGL